MIQLDATSRHNDTLLRSMDSAEAKKSSDSFQGALSAELGVALRKGGTNPAPTTGAGVGTTASPAGATASTTEPVDGLMGLVLAAEGATTASPASATPASATAASATPAIADGSPMAEIVSSTPTSSSPTAATSSEPSTSAAASSTSTESFDNAYWASQPPAVQVLRGMTDENQRMVMADQLQQQGYSIDVPVMVWGWDPSIATSMRQSYGYTWIPSLGQAPIQMAPGFTGMGQPYNPNNPPPGSIIVPPAAS